MSGEQYEGFRLKLEAGALGIEGEAGEGSGRSATAMPYPRRPMTREEAARFLAEQASLSVTFGSTADRVKQAYRRAASYLHPDAGGDPEEFRKLQEARDVLLGGGA